MNPAITADDSPRQRIAPPHLRPMRFDDYAAVRLLASKHSIAFPSLGDWDHRWVHNPIWQRLGKRATIGWVLESVDGEIVGSMESVPILYKFRGEDLICAAAALWCVGAPYRGLALTLIDEYFNQPVDLFIGTTISSASTATLSQLYDRVPVGRWDTTSCCIGHAGEFAKQSLQKLRVPFSPVLSYPLAAVLSCAQAIHTTLLSKPPGDVSIETAGGFDDRFDAFWHELKRLNPETLLAERSSRALSWHFLRAIRDERLWIFTACRRDRLVAYCIFQKIDAADGSRRARLIDYKSIEERDLLPGFIRQALRRCSAEHLYVLDHVGVDVPGTRAFDRSAMYSRPLGTWMFLFRAGDPALEDDLHEAKFWDPSLYDGDATL